MKWLLYFLCSFALLSCASEQILAKKMIEIEPPALSLTPQQVNSLCDAALEGCKKDEINSALHHLMVFSVQEVALWFGKTPVNIDMQLMLAHLDNTQAAHTICDHNIIRLNQRMVSTKERLFRVLLHEAGHLVLCAPNYQFGEQSWYEEEFLAEIASFEIAKRCLGKPLFKWQDYYWTKTLLLDFCQRELAFLREYVALKEQPKLQTAYLKEKHHRPKKAPYYFARLVHGLFNESNIKPKRTFNEIIQQVKEILENHS